MISKEQQLEECKTALAALEIQINEATDEFKSAKIQFQGALQEGQPVIVANFKSLYEGSSAHLTALQNNKQELLKRETILSAQINEELQKVSPVSDDSFRHKEMDALIARCSQYLFHTENWTCVTAFGMRKAVTFAHKEHSAFKEGDTLKIHSVATDTDFDVKVIKTNAERDWILLESDVDLCTKEPKLAISGYGRGYFQFGLSATLQLESPLSISKGVISSSRLNKFGHILGSAGANPGDSGGGCFDDVSGCLIGINVGCETTPINLKDSGYQIFDNVSSRYAARAHIIPIITFL